MDEQMLTSKTLNQLLLKNLKTQFGIVLVRVKDMPLMLKLLNSHQSSTQGPLVGLGVHQCLLSSQPLHSLLGKIPSIWSPSTHANDRNSSRFHSDQIQLGSSSPFNWGKASQ
ncbi:hypothetical protein DSO57_1039691 [Entomophthora muscae]|uniref:Uncharacterized protein n=1 Tax=Entomophthora muscae TaxID=34485 RepID=A0ACC2T7A7_9FUNG|nr:hypothetical protein DSO57_1039691 [Entomophthora muscae]